MGVAERSVSGLRLVSLRFFEGMVHTRARTYARIYIQSYTHARTYTQHKMHTMECKIYLHLRQWRSSLLDEAVEDALRRRSWATAFGNEDSFEKWIEAEI